MTDICTLVMVTRTAMACVAPFVCAPDPALKMMTTCRPGPPAPCNYHIETYSCTRDDGSKYQTTIERK